MLETLLDAAEGTELPLNTALLARYGGPLRLPTSTRHLYANFVSTIDGIVSFGTPGSLTASNVSRGFPADRFMLGILRAAADAVIVGAGTLRAERGAVWTPEHPFPDAAAEFAALRTKLGKPTNPVTVLVSASGKLDPQEAVFRATPRVIVLTTARGERELKKAPVNAEVRVLPNDPPTGPDILDAITDLGPTLLTEGGPTLFGTFVADGCLDELFLTVAPQLAGRSADARRMGLLEGQTFTPATAPWGRLAGIKRDEDYLFLRFALSTKTSS